MAVEAALLQKDYLAKFQTVIRHRTRPVLASQPSRPPGTLIESAGIEEETPIRSDETIVGQPKDEDPIVIIKSTLIDIIQGLSPGTAQFDADIVSINAILDELADIHRVESELTSAAEALRDQKAALNERCLALVAELANLKADIEIGGVSFVEPPDELVATAATQVSDIKGALDDIQALKAELDGLSRMPPTSSISERARRNNAERTAIDSILSIGSDLQKLLAGCVCLVISEYPEPSRPRGR